MKIISKLQCTLLRFCWTLQLKHPQWNFSMTWIITCSRLSKIWANIDKNNAFCHTEMITIKLMWKTIKGMDDFSQLQIMSTNFTAFWIWELTGKLVVTIELKDTKKHKSVCERIDTFPKGPISHLLCSHYANFSPLKSWRLSKICDYI